MGGSQIWSDAGDIAGSQTCGHRLHAPVLAEDMPDAALEQFRVRIFLPGASGPEGGEHTDVVVILDRAKGRHFQQCGCLVA
jgi:hypothetical protein